MEPADVREEVRQHGALEDFGHHVLPLEPGGVGEGNAASAGHLLGQGDVVGLEPPSGSVEERHDPDHFTAGGEGHGQRGGIPRLTAIGRARRNRCQMGSTGPVGHGGGRLGVEGNGVGTDQALGGR
jgi:hypothetical protein